MARVFVLKPVPQVLVQPLYLDQAVTLQSTGQGCALQTRCIFLGHSSPPWAAARATSMERDRTPAPQDLEQAVQGFQACWQSTGQGWALQLRFETRPAQLRPP